MGYKVINKNAIVNPKKNIVIDTIFFFNTLESAEEYVKFSHELGSEKHIEKMTKDEECKFNFTIPLNYQIPHMTITRPYAVTKNQPYWIQTSELVMPNNNI